MGHTFPVTHPSGGEDMPQIQVDIRQLEGPGADRPCSGCVGRHRCQPSGVRLISETMANGSADLFMEELTFGTKLQ